MEEQKQCPHCGAALPVKASFCPVCTESLNRRTVIIPPKPVLGKALRAGVVCLLVLALSLGLYGFYRDSRPKIYDNGTAEVLYPAENSTYQICIAWADEPFTPFDDRYSTAELDFPYRYPVLLYVNHAESDTHAGETFLQRVERVTAEFIDAPEALRISCTAPAPNTDYIPDAACITYVDYNVSEAGDYTAELVLTLELTSGDVVRLHQNHHFYTIPTYDYTPEDMPMETLKDVQGLIDEVTKRVSGEAVINVHLPPVTYDGGLTLRDRPVNLIGSTDEAGNRTAFTGTMQITAPQGDIFYFDNIDFTGNHTAVGLSASARLHLTNCRVSGWKTGALAYGYSWVNADGCIFENNLVGLRFNSIGSAVSDTLYEDNMFRENGTAVVLESVPTDISLKFPGCTFTGNEEDFDNQCGQTLELDGATFE